MPIKRNTNAPRETPAEAAARRDVEEQMAATLAALPPQTKAERKASREHVREFNRLLDKAFAKWDALPPTKRAARAAKLLTELRDMGITTLGEDGGRMHYALAYVSAKRAKANPPAPLPTWEQREAVAVAERAANAARIAATATEAPPAAVEPPAEPKRRKRRRRSGLGGYFDPATGRILDPRLFDEDDR